MENVDDAPMLSKLQSPSQSNQFNSGEDLKLLEISTAVLISNLIKATDGNEMIVLASKTFTFLDSMSIDYLQLYNAVHSLICHQCDKEVVDIQKRSPAFVVKPSMRNVGPLSPMSKKKNLELTSLSKMPNKSSIRAEELKKAEPSLLPHKPKKCVLIKSILKQKQRRSGSPDEMVKAQVVIEDIDGDRMKPMLV